MSISFWKKGKGDKKWGRKHIRMDLDWDLIKSGGRGGFLKEKNTAV